jgi:SAM-dependent methyltransferase
MREICRGNCGPDTSLVAGTAEALPFADGAFDTVWASQVIHHIADLPAFARNLHRILKPGGTLLLRGGFGPVTDVLLYRYFPLAWSAGAVHPPLAEITALLAAAGLHQTAHTQVAQLFASDAAELLRKVCTRSLSPLAALPDPAFQAGLHHLETDLAHGRLPLPLAERLDLVVFRR